MNFSGIDACPKGWFLVSINKNLECNFGIFSDIHCLWEKYQASSLLLIDIPIGLPFSNNRRCDVTARKILKKRASSVFPAPSREAIYAQNYKDACRINYKILKKKISNQTWNISHKIREIDDFLSNNKDARNRIRESHPEICFWALAGGYPMQHNKKTTQGINERLKILQIVYSGSEKFFKSALKKYKRKDLSRDDILDAICLAFTASSPPDTIVTIPEQPPKDLHNLAMEIVYTKRNL